MHGKGTDRQTDIRTLRLLDRIGPVGRFGEKDFGININEVLNVGGQQNITIGLKVTGILLIKNLVFVAPSFMHFQKFLTPQSITKMPYGKVIEIIWSPNFQF